MSVHFCFNIFCYAQICISKFDILWDFKGCHFCFSFIFAFFYDLFGKKFFDFTSLKLSQRATLLWIHYFSPHFCIQQMVMDKAIKNGNIFSPSTAFFRCFLTFAARCKRQLSIIDTCHYFWPTFLQVEESPLFFAMPF